MKKLFSAISAILIICICHAQQYNYENINNELVSKALYGAVTDNNGNVIVYGYTSGSISFGNFQVTGGPAFVAKKNQAGIFLWAKTIDKVQLPDYSSNVYIQALAADASGNILITGMFWGRIKLDNIILTSTQIGPQYILGPAYTTDMFVAKMSPDGAFLWASLLGNPNEDCNGNELGTSVTSDNAGNVYAAGRLYDKLIKNTNACSCGPNTQVSTAVVVKFSPAGVKLWDRRYLPSQPSRTFCNTGASAGTVVSDGVNTYIRIGMFGTVKFGTFTVSTGNDTINNTVILKLDANGNPLWVKSVSNSKNGSNSLVIDNNSLYLIGVFGPGTINFGGPALTTSNSGTGYMAKYNLSGACAWATMPGIQSPNGNLITLPNGNPAVLRDYTLKEFSANNGAEVDSTVSSNIQNSKFSGYPKLSKTSTGYIIAENLQGSYDYGNMTISSTQSPGSAYYDMMLIKYEMAAPPIARPGNIGSETTYNACNIILYPNPANRQITLRNKDNKLLGTVSIYDASGKMIYRQFIVNAQSLIDIQKFVPGVYYLQSDQMTSAIKFVKQ